MKKFLTYFVAVVLILCLALTGCAAEPQKTDAVVTSSSAASVSAASPSASDSATQSSAKKQFIFISPYYATSYWQYVQEGFKTKCAELGIESQIVGTEGDDINELQNLMEAAVASNVDAIGTAGFGGEGLKPNIAKAHEKNIPVVFADCDSSVTGRDGYVGTDNVVMGETVAKELVAQLSGKGNVVFFCGMEELPHLALRKKGILNILEAQPNIKIVHMEDNEGKMDITMEKTEAVLEKYDNINGFICQDGLGIPGIVQVLTQKGYKPGQMLICGTDQEDATLAAIKDGYCYATVVQSSYAMGYFCAEQLNKLVNGEKIEDIKTTPLVTLKKDTIDSYNPKALS
jgi:ABC-type sugar transport system substrate-binding protein